jgi:hypothetical protein
MESEGESRPSRICLPYWDVHTFCNNGLEVGKFPPDTMEDVAGARL